ncbi:hypothetical protein CHI95_07705 [Providencia rettgeri]|nr:hypothetical protein CHI95_07705 [Providencia rettgeri]
MSENTIMTMKQLIVIGARDTGTSLTLVNQALINQYSVVIIISDKELLKNVFSPEVTVVYLEKTQKTFLNWINSHCDLSSIMVTCAHENYAVIAANICAELNLNGPSPEKIKLATSKVFQKKIFNQQHNNGFTVSIEEPVNEVKLSGSLNTLNYPLVIKPCKGSASLGVKKCHSKYDAIKHLNDLYEDYHQDQKMILTHEVIIEPYVQGREYCIEFFDGICVGVLQKFKQDGDEFFERGYTSELNLEPIYIKPVIQKVSDIINKLGLDWGPVHVDSIINEHGYHIIEINPRIAGSFICQLVHDAYQFDIVTALLNKLSDKPYCIPAKMQLSALAYVNFILLSDPITWEITETSLLENEQINVICGQQYSQERNRRAFIYTLLKHDGRAKDLT